MARVLVVEDSELIRDGVTECFEVSGHNVTAAADATAARAALDTTAFDALILDIRLPDGNGYHLAREVRADSDVPIIFLTAKDSESERVMGFEVGADDYVVKPFSAKELVLRTEAILRRWRGGQGAPGPETETFALDDHRLCIDRDSHQVHLDTELVHVTESEWRILVLLADNRGRAITRERILDECLDRPNDGFERTVDTHIGNIRSILGDADWVETVRGYGYRFVGESE